MRRAREGREEGTQTLHLAFSALIGVPQDLTQVQVLGQKLLCSLVEIVGGGKGGEGEADGVPGQNNNNVLYSSCGLPAVPPLSTLHMQCRPAA